MTLQYIKKRDGKTTRFLPDKIKGAILKAARGAHLSNPEEVTEKIFSRTLERLDKLNGHTPNITIEIIEDEINQASENVGYQSVGKAYLSYRDKRAEVKKVLAIMSKNGNTDTTDSALLIESDSHETLFPWNREKIASQLEEEAELDTELAKDISKRVENHVMDLYLRGIRRLDTTSIRSLVDLELKEFGLETKRKRQALIGIPSADIEAIIFSRSLENSNIAANNPEAVNLEIAERVQKQWALGNIFSEEVTMAHLEGRMHIHDLGYPTRVYCSSHSIEYFKKFGLKKLLANLESKSDAPGYAYTLGQHLQTALASLQAQYAGALGLGFLNIFYSSLLTRPVSVVKGKFRGGEMKYEKRDLEKHIEQGDISLDKDNPDYFEVISEKKELRDIPSYEYKQVAQNLIFAASQNAFSRGGQTLFIDFNIHSGVPSYLKNVPAIGPNGKYMVKMPDESIEMIDEAPRLKTEDEKDTRNGDAWDEGLEGKLKGGHIIVYDDLEKSAQKFAKAMIERWGEGDCNGRPFHFPKCDFHVDKNSFEDPKQLEILQLAAKIAAKNGSVYFMFDRGDGAQLAQCCRLKEKIEDPMMLKYPERLRFCGFQNVTINFAQAAYRGKTLEGTLKEIDEVFELALKAHLQKKERMQKLLDTDGSPQRSLGLPSDDGFPYMDLEKATYIYGTIGLNECVQALTGKQLHESEEAFLTGLKIASHCYKKTLEIKKRTGLKSVIEETPAESTTRRFAKIDWMDKRWGEKARKVIKGTKENPYYSNSIHFAPDADITMVDRNEGQSKFHEPFIQAGAIVHDYLGEQRPSWEAIFGMIKNSFYNTKCAQLVFSPTFTECGECGKVMDGEKELCIEPNCTNHKKETLNKKTFKVVTKIVGYNSVVQNWNGSQKQIYEDRKRAERFYAGAPGRDMSWIYNPNGHDRVKVMQFAKHKCDPCAIVKRSIEGMLEQPELKGNFDFEVYYIDDHESETFEQGLVKAAMYNVPSDVFPSVVVAGKDSYWKKTTDYSAIKAQQQCKDECRTSNRAGDGKIRPSEIREAILSRLPPYKEIPAQ